MNSQLIRRCVLDERDVDRIPGGSLFMGKNSPVTRWQRRTRSRRREWGKPTAYSPGEGARRNSKASAKEIKRIFGNPRWSARNGTFIRIFNDAARGSKRGLQTEPMPYDLVR